MPQSLSNLIMHLKPYWLDSASIVAGIEINKIIYFPLTGSAVFYEKTAANLITALAGMASGEVVQINGPCTLAGDFTVPAGGILRAITKEAVTLVGQVTLNNASEIYNLEIAEAANDALSIYGVVGPVTGTAYIWYCDISATQAGAGNAYAIGATRGSSIGNGNLYVYESHLNGVSTGGNGYAARSTHGVIDIWHGTAYGSTARYIEA